uniref:Cytochrome P450 n=1 Tax=Syphacia muris TaxID=451379 RepID=A0A0N5A8Z2_9BILA
MSIISVGCAVALLCWATYVVYKFIDRYVKLIAKVQGPPALPLLGNLHQFRLKPDEFFEQVQGVSYMLQSKNDRIARIWMGVWPVVLLYGAEESEAVLGSNKTLKKPFHYNFLSEWIGHGLLINTPENWRPRRKLLTPAFHYDILKDFVEVYNRHGTTLLHKFEKLAGDRYNEIFRTISLCTIDIICEAALGVHVDAQNKPSPYLDAVTQMKYIIHQRILKPHLYPQFMFNLFGKGKQHDKYLEILHEFTGKAIRERKKLADEAGGVQNLMKKEAASGRKRMAFLDLMLDMHAKGDLPLSGIQEEVDTFTFEGHDTTSASMNWFLHLMGTNPDIQIKVQKEVDEVLGEEDRPITYEDLGNLQYLEACIKETLRLYPSVPIIGRFLTDDIKIKDKIIPKYVGVVICPSMVHRDPKHWPDPEIFKPERFLSTESKHPYAFIPFSAGARNCIGQRFALMEEKCVLALLMRHLKVKSKLRTDEMRISAELIIRPQYGNNIRFEKRTYGDYTPIA